MFRDHNAERNSDRGGSVPEDSEGDRIFLGTELADIHFNINCVFFFLSHGQLNLCSSFCLFGFGFYKQNCRAHGQQRWRQKEVRRADPESFTPRPDWTPESGKMMSACDFVDNRVNVGFLSM